MCGEAEGSLDAPEQVALAEKPVDVQPGGSAALVELGVVDGDIGFSVVAYWPVWQCGISFFCLGNIPRLTIHEDAGVGRGKDRREHTSAGGHVEPRT